MPIERPDFDQITEADLEELLAAQVPEGPRIEYKRDTFGGSDGGRREALKDMSSFANTLGGNLVIGIEEKNGVPVALPGLPGVDVDQEILRLEQLARSGIEPRILGMRTRAIPLKAGGHCVVIRIPRSWQAPHRVSAGGHNKFYLRNSAGVHEAGVEELRTMFTQGADAVEKARAFRDKRIATIDVQRSSRPLVKHGRAILHLVPLTSMAGQFHLDIGSIPSLPDIRPLGSSGGLARFNLDGILVEREGDRLHGYVQVFRSGAIETVQASLHSSESGKVVVWGNSLEARIGRSVPDYMDFLKQLGVPPPFAVMLAFDGMSGTVVRVGPQLIADNEEPVQFEHVVVLPEVLISDYGSATDYALALRPIFDAIWNMAGKRRAATFDSSGNWRPRE
jgi:hypothetical protein